MNSKLTYHSSVINRYVMELSSEKSHQVKYLMIRIVVYMTFVCGAKISKTQIENAVTAFEH